MSEPQAAAWTCDVERIKNLEKFNAEKLTVGEPYYLSCHGVTQTLEVTDLHKIVLRTTAEKEDAFKIHLLRINALSKESAQLVAVSYKVFKEPPTTFALSDGSHSVPLQFSKFEVMSVLPQEKGKEAKPFGPYGPDLLPLPLWPAIVIGVVLLGIIILSARFLIRKAQKRKLRQELEKHQTALSPVDQLSKDFRLLTKSWPDPKSKWPNEITQNSLNQINTQFRTFLLRQFWIPALTWRSTLIIKEIQKQLKVKGNEEIKLLRVTLRELDRALMNPQKIQPLDLVQLQDYARRAAQGLTDISKKQTLRGRK